MEHRRAMKSNVMTTDSNNNNNPHHHHHHHHQWKKRMAKHQQSLSLSLLKKAPVISMSTPDHNANQENISLSGHRLQQQQIPPKNPLSWRKRWSKWFAACSSERAMHLKSHPRTISTEVSFDLFVLEYVSNKGTR
jgi:hypothetical protein